MKANPIVWFEIYVQDMPRAKAFYEAVFEGGLSKLPNPNPDTFPDLEMCAFPSSMENYGATGTLVKMAGCSSGANSTLVYFHCEDCAVEARRAAASGGSIFKEKMAIGEHGYIALVYDTEGNMIGLHSMQ
ncbi:VOC family protein [Propionivibrio sp.]|uniref:VOC family protein n=1 Tax=Propionivibrio sp. TaxID=2212460 RepID=UPI003BEF8794